MNSCISWDDIVQSDWVVLVNELHLNHVDLPLQNRWFILDFLHGFPKNVVKCNWHLASCININLVLSNEWSVVDDTASVESFDYKFYSCIHICVDLNHTVLDNLHHAWGLITLEDLWAFIEFGESHWEDDPINSLIWHAIKVVNCLQSTFNEDFEVVIISNCSLNQLFSEESILFKQVVNLLLRDLT